MRARSLAVVAGLLFAAPTFAAEGGKDPAPAKPSPDAVEKKVRELLDTFRGVNSYSSDEPKVQEIVAMGRKAVPVLKRILRECFAGEPIHDGFYTRAARDALEGLVAEEDFADLAEMLADGVLAASGPLVKLKNPKVVKALLVPIGKGFVDWDYVRDLQKFGGEKEVREALVAWLKKFGVSGGWEGACVARTVGELKVEEAIPTLKHLAMSSETDAYFRLEGAKALTAMGEPVGVHALMDIFAPSNEVPPSHYRGDAGEALNKIVGERWFIGGRGSGPAKGNFEEAVPKFKEWWKKAEATLRWDEKKVKWTW